ncbi:MAG TPA: hypothetical protein VKB57_27015 [Acidimicrobiales bacterium]|nr:hypothetical protein [Acidimicrobiales bacterium]
MAWITTDDVQAALGVTPSTMDGAYLTACTDAANAWAFRRRAAAGYIDDVDIVPGPDVGLGTTLYAVALFRERGSTDSYASFEELASGFAVTGTSSQINRLLGIGRPVADLAGVVQPLEASP